MPTDRQHAQQAKHNIELLHSFAQRSEQVKYSDWYVTVAFYAALHYFEGMLFSVKPVIPSAGGVAVEHSHVLRRRYNTHSEHHARDKVMCSDFQPIYTPYSMLYRMSRTARYNCHAPGKHDWARAESLLDEVKKECKALVRKSGAKNKN